MNLKNSDTPLLTVILVENGDMKLKEEIKSSFESQSYPNKNIVVCNRENLNEELVKVKGKYLHICDCGMVPQNEDAYAKAIQLMEQTKATIGCYGWIDEKGINRVENGYCGTANKYALLKNILDNYSGDDKYICYGTELFNKIFNICAENDETYPIEVKDGLHNLGSVGFIVEIAMISDKVVFEPTPFFLSKPNYYGENISTIQSDELFKEISELVEKVEKIDNRLLEYIAMMCLEYELNIYSQVSRRKWEGLARNYSEHINTYYQRLFSKETIFDRMIATQCDLYCATSELDSEVKKNNTLKAQNESLKENRDWLKKKKEQQEELLNKRIVMFAIKIQRKLEKLKKQRNKNRRTTV